MRTAWASSRDIRLLGGVDLGGRIESTVRLRPLTGHVERAMQGCSRDRVSRPAYVTSVLTAALETLAGEPADPASVESLCIADRKLLMLTIATMLEGADVWLFPVCESCDAKFDVQICRTRLPTTPAGDTFPLAHVEVGDHSVTLRVPTGADQRWIAESCDAATELDLLNRCVVTVDALPPPEDYIESLAAEEVATMEAALDAVAPDIGTRLELECPECSRSQIVEMDAYSVAALLCDDLGGEIHEIAISYHWGYGEIMALPRETRRRHLALIQDSQREHA